MSMTQIASVRKADMPTNRQIQDTILRLGYDFKVLGGLERQINQDGLNFKSKGKVADRLLNQAFCFYQSLCLIASKCFKITR